MAEVKNTAGQIVEVGGLRVVKGARFLPGAEKGSYVRTTLGKTGRLKGGSIRDSTVNGYVGDGWINQCLIAAGARVAGGHVENCTIGKGAAVYDGAEIDCDEESGAFIRHAEISGRMTVRGVPSIRKQQHIAMVPRVGTGHPMTLHKVRGGWRINAGCESFEESTIDAVCDAVSINAREYYHEDCHLTDSIYDQYVREVDAALAYLKVMCTR